MLVKVETKHENSPSTQDTFRNFLKEFYKTNDENFSVRYKIVEYRSTVDDISLEKAIDKMCKDMKELYDLLVEHMDCDEAYDKAEEGTMKIWKNHLI